MLGWIGLFMFGLVLVKYINDSRSTKIERDIKQRSIARRKAALEASEKQNQKNLEKENQHD